MSMKKFVYSYIRVSIIPFKPVARKEKCARASRDDRAPLSYRIVRKRTLPTLLPPSRREAGPLEYSYISSRNIPRKVFKPTSVGVRKLGQWSPTDYPRAGSRGRRPVVFLASPLDGRAHTRTRARAPTAVRTHTHTHVPRIYTYTHKYVHKRVSPSLLHPSPDLMPVRARAFERRVVRPSRGTISLFATFST